MGHLKLKDQLTIAKTLAVFVCALPILGLLSLTALVTPETEQQSLLPEIPPDEVYGAAIEDQPSFASENDSLKNYIEINASTVLLAKTFGAIGFQNTNGCVFYIWNEARQRVDTVEIDGKGISSTIDSIPHLRTALTPIAAYNSVQINLKHFCFDRGQDMFFLNSPEIPNDVMEPIYHKRSAKTVDILARLFEERQGLNIFCSH